MTEITWYLYFLGAEQRMYRVKLSEHTIESIAKFYVPGGMKQDGETSAPGGEVTTKGTDLGTKTGDHRRRFSKRLRTALHLRSVSVLNSAFRVFACHPLPCMFLKLRLVVDSSPT
jgi:hypothetical protein